MKRLVALLLFVLPAMAFCQDNQLIFVFLHKKTDAEPMPKEELDKLMEGHMNNIKRLAKEGKLLVAGPFDGGGGIFILKTSSMTDANEWIGSDPAVKANRWNIEYLPYFPLVGGACLVNEPYQMTTYNFIQFKPNVMKFNVQDGGETVEKHNRFVKALESTGNLITHGSFGGLDGGIVVMKGDLDKDQWLADPAVSGGLFELEFKKLYIARGAFCEK